MNTKEGAQQILKRIEATYVPEHRYQYVEASEFKHLDLDYYRKIQAELEQVGFKMVCDKEDLTISEAPGQMFHRVLIRVLISANGATVAAIYHPKIRALWLRLLLFILGKRVGKVFEFETEFSDGSFVCTSNAQMASRMNYPPQIHCEFHSPAVPAADLFRMHGERVARHARQYSVSPRQIHTDEEAVRMQNRMNALKAAYRGKIGGITKEELDRISPGTAELNEEVHAEIEQLNRQKPAGDRR